MTLVTSKQKRKRAKEKGREKKLFENYINFIK